MNKIWILLLAAVLSFNAQAADKKAKKPKGKGAYAKMVATLKLTAEQNPIPAVAGWILVGPRV